MTEEILFQVWVCSDSACGLRFTALAGDRKASRCPVCRSATREVGLPYSQAEIPDGKDGASSREIVLLLDNLRSAWNVGSILRSADGAGVRAVVLCGVCPRPDHPRVTKTALGAEQSVAWRYEPDAVKAVQRLQAENYSIWALEGGARSVPLFSRLTQALPNIICLVVGNELCGVDPGVLDLADCVVHLPMRGIKGSLNVAVALGAAIYALSSASGSEGSG